MVVVQAGMADLPLVAKHTSNNIATDKINYIAAFSLLHILLLNAASG